MANDRPYNKGNNQNWNKNNQISRISAPFNFVPLTDTVVHPQWASRISHDVPFSDGISGTISVRLTAQSPIFVRNGHTSSDAEKGSDTYNSFSRIGDRFFLPGTTVKGVVRNVLEILSLGKMRLDKNVRIAQREWDNKELYTLKGKQQNVRCGWLNEKNDGNYEIVDCGTPHRISHPQIEKYLSTLAGPKVKKDIFTSKFSKDSFFNINKPQPIPGSGKETFDPKTAMYKYRLIETICPLDKLRDLRFSKIKNTRNKMEVDNKGGIRGTIVLTGQPGKRSMKYVDGKQKWSGKLFEFVFPAPGAKPDRLPLTREEFEQYKFIYADSPDWKFLTERMFDTTGIPVFFRLDESGKRIFDWGLAYLYKLPYPDTPFDAMTDPHKSGTMDMADCIFGQCSDASSLKGRVQFSAFFCDNRKYTGKPDMNSRVTLTLGSPKASYYPIYIDQETITGRLAKNDSYRSYDNGYIRGWKQYLRRSSVWGSKPENMKSDVDTIIYPLSTGAEFTGRIHFHNLKPEELGALLSALTFHGDQEACHLIGMAKPYGYGKVKMDITGIDLQKVGAVDVLTGDCPTVVNGYISKFEEYMDKQLKSGKWKQTPAIKELLSMAKEDVSDSAKFRYMTLDVKNNINDFNSAKKEKLFLQPFTAIRKK